MLKFLIIDDSITMRHALQTTLYQMGFKDIVHAANGKEALKKLVGINFIISDLNMPEMNGIEFIKLVRTKPELKSIPILMVTTEGSKDQVIECIRAGANNFIVKPYDSDRLAEKINLMIKPLEPKS
ncbi:MAG: Chemotaxis regulatory protein CheY [uncultured bacterium]|nr:MAG: Chemotaxis regulatory protein CheY [uncultured bacterium]